MDGWLGATADAAVRIRRRFLGKGTLFTLCSPFMPLLVRVFSHAAETGRGSDLCLAHGFLPVRVHYYSPVPDIADLRRRRVWQRSSELPGVDFRAEQQVQLLRRLGAGYGQECRWPTAPTPDPTAFYTENGSFSFGCAASLHAMLRHHKPRRVREIGSGHSSLVISGALARNASEGHACDYRIVDPHPSPLILDSLPGLAAVVPQRVELLDPSYFGELEEKDVLFIDSGHTVRTGSDVNFLFLEVLPRLAPGVIVHVHDVGLPYEYPEVYFTNPGFRVFWTEAYLLQAFLAFNSQFEVLLALNYLMTDRRQDFAGAFPHYDASLHRATSGSFWVRRRPADARQP